MATMKVTRRQKLYPPNTDMQGPKGSLDVPDLRIVGCGCASKVIGWNLKKAGKL